VKLTGLSIERPAKRCLIVTILMTANAFLPGLVAADVNRGGKVSVSTNRLAADHGEKS